jgi:hypothetical protein
MKEVLLKLKTILSAQDFIVTGSFVLSEFGLIDKKKVSDLDIILVKPEKSTIETINRFMTDFPAKTKPKITESLPKLEVDDDDEVEEKPKLKKVAQKPHSDVSAIFMFDKVKIDVFVMDSCSYGFITVDGLKYTTIDSIIKAKKSYGRMKDWLQLRDMARNFFKEEEFTTAINGEWGRMLSNKY